MPSGVIRKRLAHSAAKTTEDIRWYANTDYDISGVHPFEYRDDSVLRKDVHPNKWAPNGIHPRAPYPVAGNQGYKREMTVVGPRAEEPLRPPDKFRPFASSSPIAKQRAQATARLYGVQLQAPPNAAEEVLKVPDGRMAREGKIRGRQPKKSSRSR